MDIFGPIFLLIDLRSFDNLWFWIALAVMWSSASHWVLGVPYDSVMRARRNGGIAQSDLEALVNINSRRVRYIADTAGLIVVAVVCFLLSLLAILGFSYNVEFAQAVFLLAFPMMIVWWMSTRTADKILSHELQGAAIFVVMRNLRLRIQIIGLISILVTSVWGMYQNVQGGPLTG